MTITLEQLLQSRDERRQRQQQLLSAHPDATLVCLTVVIPGSEKRNDISLTVARAAVEALRKTLGHTLILCEERDLITGFEAYLITTLAERDVKLLTCEIEDAHPLGRLFDIDVIGGNGLPMTRADVGRAERGCLLCDQPARYCMRNRTHTTEELLQFIEKIVASYIKGTRA